MATTTEGKLIKLMAKTRHGENRLKVHGKIWTILEERSSEFVLQSQGKPWRGEHDIRRVSKFDDGDFNWEWCAEIPVKS